MDGSVNVLDLILIAEDFGQTGTPGWIHEDVNGDGVVNIEDLIIVGQHRTVKMTIRAENGLKYSSSNRHNTSTVIPEATITMKVMTMTAAKATATAVLIAEWLSVNLLKIIQY